MWGLAILLWMAGQQGTRPLDCVEPGSAYNWTVIQDGRPTGISLSTLTPKGYVFNFDPSWHPDEPIDVPAIQTDQPCGRMYPSGHMMVCEATHGWSCADKSRILLTSEDGKRWCHKVSP